MPKKRVQVEAKFGILKLEKMLKIIQINKSDSNILILKIMKGFKDNIEKRTLENENFRAVLYTGEHLQLVLMSLKVGEEIGGEIHYNNDQFFRFESGNGKCIVDGSIYNVSAGDVLIVPSGAKHNIINIDEKQDLKLYSIYAPPNHKDGLIRATKREAEENGQEFDGKTTE